MKYVGLISKAILRIAIMNRVAPSRFESLQFVLMKMNVRIRVSIKTHTEKILSLKSIVQKLASQPWANKHVGCRFNGVITDEIPIIQRILNMSDQTTFPTHISYLFLIIAANVAATSGNDVPAATIVAQIARSDTQKYWAIYTAALTTRSDESTNIHKLAINFVQFSIIHSLFSDHFLFLLSRSDIINQIARTIRNIIEYSQIQKWNQYFPFIVSQLTKQRKRLIQNKIKKFFSFGLSISSTSSQFDSFFIRRYPL